MSFPPRLSLLFALPFALAVGGAATAPNEWKDAKGATFRGEPIEALGPLALFRTGGITSKFLPLRALPPEECVRFFQAVAHRPSRAERWSEAHGAVTGELIGRLRRSENRELKPVDLAKLPEPELLLAVLVGRRDGGTGHLFDNLGPFVNRVQRLFPGRVAAVILASWQANTDFRWLPSRSWFVVDPDKQSQVKVLSRFAVAEGMALVLMTREGVPLFGMQVSEIYDVMKFVDGASNFLWELNAANPRTARDRAHYLRAVRPVEFANGETGPLLVIDPLRVEALQQRGIKQVAAKIEVSAEGTVARVELRPDASIPEPLAAPIAEALRRNAFFLPAIAQGSAVAGVHDYVLKIPPANKQLAADAAWVKGEARVELPIKSWLILKPIHVPEQVFSTIDSVGADGTVMLKAVTAGTAGKVSTASQMNSFNSDWFAAAGAASVRPVAGEKQEVDGEKLVWKKVTPYEGTVDFQGNAGNVDFCVGYAWAEVEVPADTDAWLGIGSDDGLKIWLNGEIVVDQWVVRTSRLDDDVVPLRLKKGPNQFLIKIQNRMGLWKFTCRLRVRGT